MSRAQFRAIDFSLTREVIDGCQDVMATVEQMIGGASDETPLPYLSKTEEAEVNRHLLNLADQLVLAAALVRNEYWKGRGPVSFDI